MKHEYHRDDWRQGDTSSKKDNKANRMTYIRELRWVRHIQTWCGEDAWLAKVRDGSTGQLGSWYVFRWVNVNGISIICELDCVDENEQKLLRKDEIKIKSLETRTDKTIGIIEKIVKVLPEVLSHKAYLIIDRAWDNTRVIDCLIEEKVKFIIRMKKVRNLRTKGWAVKKITDFGLWKHEIFIEEMRCILHVAKRKWFKENVLLLTNDEEIDSEHAVAYYLKRRKVEEDFNKMKDLWLEDVRLMNVVKIKNLIALIQFIIILSQEMFNEVMKRADGTYELVRMYYEKFCKWKSLTLNPQSFIKFVSHSLLPYVAYNTVPEAINTLWWWKRELKKLGII